MARRFNHAWIHRGIATDTVLSGVTRPERQCVRKATRLFEIIQVLRLSSQPVTAAHLAGALGVAVRSIYRDIAALQVMDVPIEGGRGIGYILRPGFDLPPLMFSIEEVEALVVGLRLLQRTGDTELKEAASSARRKIMSAVQPPLRQALEKESLLAWGTVAEPPSGVDLALIRLSIRNEQKLRLNYRDEIGNETRRIIWPVALIYYSATSNIVGWCELRQAIRRFRTDRVVSASAEDGHFTGHGDRLRREWTADWKVSSADGG